MKDQDFKDNYKPLAVPSSFERARTFQEQVVFALAQLGRGTAEEVVKKLESLNPQAPDKELIAGAHQVLTELYENGLVTGNDREGSIIFSLEKITRQNSGDVN